jgi:CDP-diacylglycerol--serine O-phosphatidyltransferase
MEGMKMQRAENESKRRPELPETAEVEPPASRPLRAIALLPSMATLGNLLCGFGAIFFCLISIRFEYFGAVPGSKEHPILRELVPTYITAGVYMVVLAMIFDALDGRLARLARRTSEFGAQLDSLADVVSFGAAPALLYLTVLLPLVVPSAGDPSVNSLEWRLGLLCCLVYVSCTAIRLARYNAENTQGEAVQKRFTGMPSPGAAGGFCGLLLLYEELVRLGAHTSGTDWAEIVRWSLGPAAFLLGLLMVSRLEHVHVFNAYVRREQPLMHLVWLVVIIGLAIYWVQALLIGIAAAYVLSGLLMNLMRHIERRRNAAPRKSEPYHPN